MKHTKRELGVLFWKQAIWFPASLLVFRDQLDPTDSLGSTGTEAAHTGGNIWIIHCAQPSATDATMDACCSYSQSKAERSSVWRGKQRKENQTCKSSQKIGSRVLCAHTQTIPAANIFMRITSSLTSSSDYSIWTCGRRMETKLWLNSCALFSVCTLHCTTTSEREYKQETGRDVHMQAEAEAPESFFASEKNERAALKKGSCVPPARRLKLKSQPAHPIAAWHHFFEIQGTMGCSLVSWRSKKPSPNSFFLQDQMWTELKKNTEEHFPIRMLIILVLDISAGGGVTKSWSFCF